MNPRHPTHRHQLAEAIQHHRQRLSQHRKLRVELIRAYAGTGMAKDGGRTVANLLLQTAESMRSKLVANQPRVMVNTPFDELQGFAAHYAANLNTLATEIRLLETLQAMVLDAFFTLGICKIHAADSALVEIEQDVWADPGRPFASRVSLDRWVHDTSTGDFRAVQLAADSYRVDFDSLKDSDLYEQKAAAKLKPSSKIPRSEEAAVDIASGKEVDEDEYRPMLDLMDVWLPREGLILTWACDGDMNMIDGDPLAEREWDGAETGPYRLLGFGSVPDNILHTSPAANLKVLHDIVNSTWKKMNMQQRQQENIKVFEPSATEDAKRLDNHKNRWTQIQRKEGLGMFSIPGVDQSNVIFAQNALNMYDRTAGRGSQAGMGMQADTATQESYIRGEISDRDGFTSSQVLKFVSEIFQDLGRLLWKDDTLVLNSSVEVPRIHKRVRSNWNQDRGRQGEIADYLMSVSPYSMPYRSPEQEASLLKALVVELAQAIPMLQQAGGDAAEYVHQLSEFYHLPQLKRIYPMDVVPRAVMPAPSGGGGGMGALGKPNGNYTRTNVSRGPSAGNSNNLVTAMQGMGASPGGMMGAA